MKRLIMVALMLGVVCGATFSTPLRVWWLDVREEIAWDWFLIHHGCIFRFQCPERLPQDRA